MAENGGTAVPEVKVTPLPEFEAKQAGVNDHVTKEAPKVEKNTVAPVPEIIEMHSVPPWLAVLAVVALLLAGLTTAWVYMLQSHVTATETALEQAGIENKQLKDQVQDMSFLLKAQTQTLAQKVGMTQQQLEDRSKVLVAEEKSEAAAAVRLQQHQIQTDQKVSQVQNDVEAVKTDVSAVKTDVATQQAEQMNIKKQVAQVASAQTELGTQIATNRTELRVLKAKGDRTYYEFAIEKGAPAVNLGTIKLSAKSVDERHGKFTIVIGSNDRNIEKVNQSLDQSIQFYSGKNPELFEVVVNGISKRMISGYLSVPKDAPKPILP